MNDVKTPAHTMAGLIGHLYRNPEYPGGTHLATGQLANHYLHSLAMQAARDGQMVLVLLHESEDDREVAVTRYTELHGSPAAERVSLRTVHGSQGRPTTASDLARTVSTHEASAGVANPSLIIVPDSHKYTPDETMAKVLDNLSFTDRRVDAEDFSVAALMRPARPSRPVVYSRATTIGSEGNSVPVGPRHFLSSATTSVHVAPANMNEIVTEVRVTVDKHKMRLPRLPGPAPVEFLLEAGNNAHGRITLR